VPHNQRRYIHHKASLTMTKDTYRLAGNRQGWDFKGCTRTDKPDGYTEFRKPNGTVHAVVLTAFLTPEKDG
jgi:hypothetical protein